MKHIMISIKPEYVCKILNKEKLLEIRKSIPKCELPCKVYIYCTKGKDLWMHNKDTIVLGNTNLTSYYLNGKVVAIWHLKEVDKFKVFENGSVQNWNCYDLEKSCLTYDELANYVGKNKNGYAWHIEDLHIYDTPKELAEFGLKRPPQSWCYIKGEENEVKN